MYELSVLYYFPAEGCTSTLENNADYDFPESETSHIAGGEAPQNVATGTSQSGVEPVSGKLGRGEAGEPYDAGNVDGMSIRLDLDALHVLTQTRRLRTRQHFLGLHFVDHQPQHRYWTRQRSDRQQWPHRIKR